jgi:glycosyltransferase involved in cell wall biosynthesis
MPTKSEQTVTCVIPCKGRLDHLQGAIPLLLAQQTSFAFEILVVDFGCPDGTWQWCRNLADPRVNCLAVLDRIETFHMSRARNCGNRQVGSGVIVALDADCRFHSIEVLQRLASEVVGQRARSTHTSLQLADGGTHDAHSFIAYSYKDWLQVRGYDEAMTGYGYEDTDFYYRIQDLGHCNELTTPYHELGIVTHSNELRTRHYNVKNQLDSWVANREQALNRACCNPVSFGTGRVAYYCGRTG